MIWILLILTAFTVMLFLFGPLLTRKDNQLPRGMIGICAALGFVGITGLYAFSGSPELSGKHADSLRAQYYYSEGLISQSVEAYEDLIRLYPDNEALKKEFDQVLSDLQQVPKEQLQIIQTIAELKQKLYAENSVNTEEWRLLANGQMRLGDYDGALKSYERLTALAPNNEAFKAEFEKARNFIAAEKQAQSMSADDRQAMIENMVEGLAARLYEEGGTPEEWERLLRSRRQLGQEVQLIQDLLEMTTQLEGQPDIRDAILQKVQ